MNTYLSAAAGVVYTISYISDPSGAVADVGECRDIDECSSDPCMNGATCLDELDQFSCQCAAGFTSTVCDVNINECASDPCINAQR